jgi:hypothetical protein
MKILLASIDRRFMSTQLKQYFERYAEDAITQMKDALIAIDYYERIRLRLVKKEDLSGELAIIAKVGPEGTMTVVKNALTDYKAQVANAWNLAPRLQDIGTHRVNLIVNEREHLPRADVHYQFKSSAGTVKVHITSAAETYQLEITGGKNRMAAELAYRELEKQLTFIALTS